MAVLTERQEEILQFIIKRIQEKGYPPSVREIGANVGLSSTSTVHAHLTRLEEKGIIRKDPTKPRALEIIDPDYANFNRDPNVVNIPIVSEVTRARPENTEGYIKLSKELIGNEPVFILRATDNLNKPSSFVNNDYIIVQEQNTASTGELVVAVTEEGSGIIKSYESEKETIIGRIVGNLRLNM